MVLAGTCGGGGAPGQIRRTHSSFACQPLSNLRRIFGSSVSLVRAWIDHGRQLVALGDLFAA
jgi:hypothetical protein